MYAPLPSLTFVQGKHLVVVATLVGRLAGWLPRSCSTLMLLLLLLGLFADYHSISPYEGDEGNVFEGDDDEGPRANAGRG